MLEDKNTAKYKRRTFTFSPEDIDAASDFTFGALDSFGLPRKDALRVRFSQEEVLLNWREREDRSETFTVELQHRLGRIQHSVRCQGASCNPLAIEVTEDYGSQRLGQSMLENLGLSSAWQYRDGANVVSTSLRRKQKLSQLAQVVLAVVLAAVFGWLGLLLPDKWIDGLLTMVLDPLFNTFLGIFTCIVGPMMFLAMVWGIVNIGDVRQLGSIGKKLLGRFLMGSMGLGIIVTFIAVFYYGLDLSGTQGGQAVVQSIVEMILDIIPGNVVEPFLSGNTLQILFMGVVVGIGIILLRERMTILTHVVEQSNAVVQLILSAISRLVPAFIFLSVFRLILQGTLAQSASGLLKVILVTVIISAADILIQTLTLTKHGLSVGQAFKKLSPTLLIALSTASSAAAFPEMLNASTKKLGVDEKLVNFALPFGSVVFMPHAVILFIMIPLFFAQSYGIELTAGSIIICLINAVVLSVAAPPIPGGAISCYTLMFLQLGIPLEAIALAAAANVVLDFTATAGQIHSLLVQLTHGAKRMGMVKEEILLSKE
ncbi:MAG: cation:dicarboxylase symporter family transporter [Firmicutes bacterium]|nr:cation:dicarboxylase symporter family transporter [Bacillota bacterium]